MISTVDPSPIKSQIVSSFYLNIVKSVAGEPYRVAF